MVLSATAMPEVQAEWGVAQLCDSLCPSPNRAPPARALQAVMHVLQVRFEETGHSSYLAWSPAVALCTNLTSLVVSQTDLNSDCQLPSSIGNLVRRLQFPSVQNRFACCTVHGPWCRCLVSTVLCQ